MSPRKVRYQVPKYIADSIRTERKKILHGPYSCPKCGFDGLRIRIDEEEKKVNATCKCGFSYPLEYIQNQDAVYYYNELIDRYYK